MEEDLEGTDNESVVPLSIADVETTVAFSLIAEAEKLNQISFDEAEFLREKYRKLFEANESARAQDHHLSRKMKVVETDILSEKILLEKARMEEVDETIRVQRAGELRNSLQKELEDVEQKDTMVKFELFELKKAHDELQKSLSNMKKQNSQMVEPVLERLKKETAELNEQFTQTAEAHDRDAAQKKFIQAKVIELETLKMEKETIYQSKLESLRTAEAEPGRLQRQIASIENASISIKSDENSIMKKIQVFAEESNLQAQKKSELLKLRTSILEKLELNRQTLEERERDIQSVSMNLEKAKALSHDLVTRKLELNIRKKELDNQLRHLNEQLGFITKEYEGFTRQMKKKTIVLDLVRQNIPGLESQLKDQEMLLINSLDEKNKKKKEIGKLKDEIDYHIGRLLTQEGVETEKKRELEDVIEEVDELEEKVAQCIAEGKKQSKLLSLLSAQRDIKARENARIETKDREAKHQVRTKELVILDLTKRCNEITNRLKEFSALYEVVKNERNKYVNLIQSSAQALAEMREKIRILQNEVEILSNERAAKDLALTKERNAHQQAQNQRDALRQDLNRLLSEYRSRQGTVEQQIQEIDKLNVVINNLEKEMLQLKTRYEHAVEERNITGVQLIDRNDELCILYERSNQQMETLKKGEMILIKLEENIRLLRLYYEELNRTYVVAKNKIPLKNSMEKRIAQLSQELEREAKLTEEYSSKLEDPGNLTRWRPLEGSDLDVEQLLSKIQILEKRLDEKREAVLAKELILEEITNLTDKLRNQALSKRENAKLLADELNDLHSKIRDISKKMLASVSELSMYQATALRLQQEKLHREKLLDDAKWKFNHGEAPSEQAEVLLHRTVRNNLLKQEMALKKSLELPLAAQPNSTHLVKTAAEPRPTAYIPDDLGIPKPYGNLAPFKPTELGSTMRHIRLPVVKPIEL